MKTGYPGWSLGWTVFVALKKNLSAACVPLFVVVVVIPVIIPVKPSAWLNDVTFSVWNGGNSIRTSGGLEWV